MLVTCPECGARYEIEGSLIPPEGRRVECSACEHVWLEVPGAERAEPTPEPADERPKVPPFVAPAPPRESDGDEEAPPSRPPLADEVRAILREEAEREARVRRERGLIEIQPELALGQRTAEPRRRQHPAATALPDPDAINDTLRTASRRAATAQGRRSRAARGGFVGGLVVGLCIVGLAALVYVQSPWIEGAIPAAEPALAAYVDFVDDLRLTLDRTAARTGAAVSDLMQADG